MQQSSLSGTFDKYHKRTKQEIFLGKMDKLIPWQALCSVIEPHYPKAGKGRPPRGLERMLRMYFIAQWFNLADEACEEFLYNMPAARDFCHFDLGNEPIPDATTLENFRHLLERHQLGEQLFAAIGGLLLKAGLRLSNGTIVDATIIAAPSSTKNADKERDPEMSSTKKGGQWHFGMKVHIGTDSKTGLVHSSTVTTAKVHDSQELTNLMHGDETRLYGDSAYTGQKQTMRKCAPKVKDFTNQRGFRNHGLNEAQQMTNRRKSSVRARVEHPFLWIKRIWGFAKVRYRGLTKNANRAFVLLALFNIVKWNKPLTP
jgi:IS5 family transposase